jgi:hypothetical protein
VAFAIPTCKTKTSFHTTYLYVVSGEMAQSEEEEEEISTESMTVAEAKEKYRNGDLTTDDASVTERISSNGSDATFICSDGYFVIAERIVETKIEDQG